MSVVRVPTVLRPATGGEAIVKTSGATIGEVFQDLVERFPGLRAQVLNDDGTLHRHLNVFLNDDDIRYIGRLEAKVGEDDEITLMPAVAGGALAKTAGKTAGKAARKAVAGGARA